MYLPEAGGAEDCSLIHYLEGYVGHSFTRQNFDFCALYKSLHSAEISFFVLTVENNVFTFFALLPTN